MIIALSGYISSGKDTVAQMINYMLEQYRIHGQLHHPFNPKGDYTQVWEIKKFAAKLKQIASLLTGIPVEKFEDQEFKNSLLGPEWIYYKIMRRDSTASHRFYNCYTLEEVESKIKSFKDTLRYEKVQMTVREFLQKLGTEAIRDGLHSETWVNALFADYKIVGMTDGWVPSYNNPDNSGLDQPAEPIYPNWIISDCRYANEAKAVKDHGGVIWRINRPAKTQVLIDIDSMTRAGQEAYKAFTALHPSETSLDDWPFDAVINNNGTLEDLLLQVQTLLKTQQIL